MASYWDNVLTKRIGRRRALAATGGLAAGAALLAACGGGDGDGDGGGPVSGLLYTPVDTSKSAKRGGVYKSRLPFGNPTSFDLHAFNNSIQPFGNVIGSELVKLKAFKGENATLEIEGDIAEDWEFSSDKLTLTFKLNPKAKWAPLSSSFHSGVPSSIAGRVVDADDVVFSWQRFEKTATAFGRLELANSYSKANPVLSVTKVDDKTVQMKLARPWSAVLPALATWNVGYFYILPKEGRDNAIDFVKYAIGAGPYYIDKYEPSVGMTLKRNPYYEERDADFKLPYADTIDLPILVDPTAALAQFRVGNIYNGGFTVGTLDDILKLKSDIPDLLVRTAYTSDAGIMAFGQGKDSPWRDERMRQAISYAWNKDLMTQVVFTTDKLEAQGIPANVRWSSALPSNTIEGFPNGTYEGYWLDPKDTKEFGENAKYYEYKPAEAKALIKAVTGKDTFTFEHMAGFVFPSTNYGIDIFNGMVGDAGFNVTRKPMTAADFTSLTTNLAPGETIARNWGNWVGLVTGIDSGGPDPGSYLHQHYHKDGGRFLGYSADGSGATTAGDPFMNDTIEKMMTEFDEKKRQDLAKEFSKYFAK